MTRPFRAVGSLWLRVCGLSMTTLFINVPEAAEAVRLFAGPWEGDIPPHITIAYPLPRILAGRRARAQLEEVCAAHHSFTVDLRRLGRFEEVAYLAPSADDAIQALSLAVLDRFPGNPLYGGAYETYIPHLALGPLTADVEDRETAVCRVLPIEVTVRELELWGFRRKRWRLLHRFQLGAPQRLPGSRPRVFSEPSIRPAQSAGRPEPAP